MEERTLATTPGATMTVSKGYQEGWESLAACMRRMCDQTGQLSRCLANTGHDVPDCFETVIGGTNHQINNTPGEPTTKVTSLSSFWAPLSSSPLGSMLWTT